MPQCQAINCTTRSGSKKSYFSMPDPSKSAEDRRLCKLWIDKLKNAKLDIKTFKASRTMVVCEDHFTDDCFVGVYANTVAESLSFRHSRKILKKGSVPTIKKNLIALRESHSNSSVAEVEVVQQSSLESPACVDKCVISGDEDTELVEQPPFGQTVVEYPPFEQTTVEYPPFTATPLVMAECQYTGQPMCVEEVVVQTTVSNRAVPVTRDMGTQTEPSVSSKPEATFSCGHPCILCVPDNISKALESDHSYFQTPARKSSVMKIANDNTPDLLHGNEINSHILPTHSTPRKSLLIPEKLNFHSDTIDEEDELNDSDMSYSFRDDSHDMTYVCDADLEDSDSENEYDEIVSKCLVDENKFLVFESCLDQLFIRLKCSVPSCTSSIDPDDIKKDMTNGSNLHSSVYCASGHLVMSWNSQPVLGKMAAGNLLMSAAILFSGLAHGRVEQFAKHLNLNFISHTTFNNIQREQLMPVVLDSWKILQHSLLQEVRASGRPLRLAGDGRCDSPGFSAKYCTYSLLDLETDSIVSFVVVNVNETGSSSRMELEGFRRCLTYLLDLGFRVEVITTDRHVQIRSVIKKEFSETNHHFDVWHLAKSVKKKLALKAKAKGLEGLQEWSKSICNHLWWCAANCKGDPDWLEECWVSVVNHVTNVHSFSGNLITSCPHTDIPSEVARRKKWLKPGSKVHNALKEVILDKRLRKDIRQLSEFCHTGSLECYHSLMTKYVPKRQEFDQDQMETRTALAAIDHNMSRNRQQKVNRSGENMYKIVCPKATVQWVAKPVYEQKNYDWVNVLMKKTVDQKEEKLLPVFDVKKRSNIAPHPAPAKNELIQKMKSRFKCTN